jgi:uncharacterized zinc-type alcohol dehydrogenase-like protein
MIDAIGYAAKHSFSRLKPFPFQREDAGPNDVVIDVMFCGVCHSDIHQVKNEWSNTVYPCMPGHEVVGRVSAVGSDVSQARVGDLVGVGCMLDSCRTCEPCASGDENYCEGPNSWLATYNGPMVPKAMAKTGENSYGRDNTFGGYSSVLVVHEDFVLMIPDGLDPAAAAPILCAGVTTYSPLTQWDVGAGQQVGVVGYGGLGNMAVKLARAMGAEVTIFTSSKEKAAEATANGLTAVHEGDAARMAELELTFDFILSTVPEKHDINPFVALLKRDATLCVVGALEPLVPVNNQQVAFHRRTVTGSLIGSIAETQEVLEFCADHSIAPDIEVIRIQDVNDAFKKVESGDVRYRYVIDMSSLHADADADADAGAESEAVPAEG